MNDDAVCETDSSLNTPFYFNGERDQVYRIADTQTIPDMGSNQYAVSWYVDTEEWDLDPQKAISFQKLSSRKVILYLHHSVMMTDGPILA